jgi:hypothetical protein
VRERESNSQGVAPGGLISPHYLPHELNLLLFVTEGIIPLLMLTCLALHLLLHLPLLLQHL